MEPRVLHLIPCDNVREDALNFHRLDIRGLKTRIWTRVPPPVRCDLCVFWLFFTISSAKESFGFGLLRLQLLTRPKFDIGALRSLVNLE
jgi:hypothetical protein